MTPLDDARARVRSLRLRHELKLRYQVFVAEQLGEQPESRGTLLARLKNEGWLETGLFYGVYGRRGDELAKIESLAEQLTWAAALAPAHAALDHLQTIAAAGNRPPVSQWQDSLRQFYAESGRVFVVSDVHLGIEPSAYNELDNLFALCRPGDRLILLGDVLDFWIAGLDQRREHETVRRVWTWLFERIAVLHGEGVDVHYVPGNHDPFVFTLHSLSELKWGETVLKHSAFIRELGASTAREFRLTKVLAIHYPYLKLEIAGEPWLFTHGHMHEWLWQLFTPNTQGAGLADSPSFWAGATALSTVFAHRFASQLRTLFLARDTFGGAEQWVADVGILITHQVIESLDAAIRARDWEGFASELERAIADYRSANPGDPRVGPIRAGIERLQASYQSRNLQEVSDRERAWMRAHPGNFNFTCPVDRPGDDRIPPIETTPLRELVDFKHFVCGHFHQPRLLAGPPVLADSGAVLSTVRTTLQINPDGWIGRPMFAEAV